MADDTEIATQTLIPTTTLDGVTTEIVSKVIDMNKRGAAAMSLHTLFNEDTATTQDLVATALLEISNDPRALVGDGSSAKWIDATLLGITIEDIVAGEGSVADVFSVFVVGFMRLTYTRVSGEGDARTYISGQD